MDRAGGAADTEELDERGQTQAAWQAAKEEEAAVAADTASWIKQ